MNHLASKMRKQVENPLQGYLWQRKELVNLVHYWLQSQAYLLKSLDLISNKQQALLQRLIALFLRFEIFCFLKHLAKSLWVF